MNHYFGAAWNANIRTAYQKTPTPVGGLCSWCEEEIVEGDQGFVLPQGNAIIQNEEKVFDRMEVAFRPVHLDCFLRQIYGSVGHIEKKCSCHGGDREDPPGLTVRQAATASVKLYESKVRSVCE